jgi:hypothetical protein
MSLSLPPPTHVPCPECGGSIARGDEETHRCDPERRLDYVMFQLRSEVDAFDSNLSEYLESPRGRFEQWDAERRRSRPDA